MTAPQRRRSPRYPSDWSARYRFEPTAEWRDCRVIDVSLDGAAVLLDPDEGDSPTGMLDLEINAVAGDQIGVALRAQVRHRVRLRDGQLMVGVEFAARGQDRDNLLRLLFGLQPAV